jgi:hypothetical protein
MYSHDCYLFTSPQWETICRDEAILENEFDHYHPYVYALTTSVLRDLPGRLTEGKSETRNVVEPFKYDGYMLQLSRA